MKLDHHYPEAFQELRTHAVNDAILRAFDVHLQNELIAVTPGDLSTDVFHRDPLIIIEMTDKLLFEMEFRVVDIGPVYRCVQHMNIDTPIGNFTIKPAFR